MIEGKTSVKLVLRRQFEIRSYATCRVDISSGKNLNPFRVSAGSGCVNERSEVSRLETRCSGFRNWTRVLESCEKILVVVDNLDACFGQILTARFDTVLCRCFSKQVARFAELYAM